MRSITDYIERFMAIAGPMGIPLIVLGFVILFASLYFDGGREELYGALFLVLGAVFYKLDQPGGIFQSGQSSKAADDM